MTTFKNIDSLNVDDLKKNLNLYNVSFAYFANCNIIPETNVIEHHIVSSNDPGDSGSTLKRSFEFRGDTLILTAKEIIDGHKARLRWIKKSG